MTIQTSISVLTIGVLLTGLGCGETHDSERHRAMMMGGVDVTLETSEGDARLEYPAGPYGLDIGDTSPARSVFTDRNDVLHFSELYVDPNQRLLVIFASAGWCTRCAVHMPGLRDLHETFTDDGLYLAVSIHENANYLPAKISDAHGYRRQYELPFTVLADTDGQILEYFDTFSMPMIITIDLETMEILRIDQEWVVEEMKEWIEDRLIEQ